MDDQLAQAARNNSAVVLGQVVSGMGGVGKTQLAVHHTTALQTAGEVDLVVWVPAADRASIVQTYAQAAHTVVPGHVEENPEQAAHQFRVWLQNTDKRWLVVLDNLDDPDQAQGLWPPTITRELAPTRPTAKRRWRLFQRAAQETSRVVSPQGRVVVTTRRADLVPPGRERFVVPVDTYTPTEALEYLTNALRFLPSAPAEDNLRSLAEELGFLPLALSHAAAYLTDPTSHTSCADYLQRFRSRKDSLHRLFPQQGLPEDYPWTVATTWAMSIEHANDLTPRGLAQPLMRLISLLDPAGIPAVVLVTEAARKYLAHHQPGNQAPSQQDVVDALALLERFYLIQRSCADEGPVGGMVVTAHRVVQRATRDHPLTRPDRVMAVAAADALMEVWLLSLNTTPNGKRLRSNYQELIAHGKQWLWESKVHEVHFLHGNSLCDIEAFDQAIDHWSEIHAMASQVFGPDHRDALLARYNLALSLGEAGLAKRAVNMLDRLIPELNRTSGPEDLTTLGARYYLANWRGRAGDTAGAATTAESLLHDILVNFNKDHRNVLLARLSLIYWRGQEFDKSKAVVDLKELVLHQERVLGVEDLYTLGARHTLATWIGELGDAVGAATYLECLREDMENALGAEHPSTLSARYSLACWHGESGNSLSAIGELKILLADQERIFGSNHPKSLMTRNELVYWLAQSGDSVEIESESAILSEKLTKMVLADFESNSKDEVGPQGLEP
ncbi:GTP-binding protein [Nocardiopsis alba]|uniref:GTP-binding protein n=1 Tax=Nocardiopsis alba TaxID=53437 RepID=UPI00366D7417